MRRRFLPWRRSNRARLRALDLRGVAIVLAHGYLASLPSLYWWPSMRLWRDLRRTGCMIVHADLPRTGTIAERGTALGQLLDTLPAKRIVIVAHSMGGLDARWAVLHADRGGRISDVITIGTPHLGTPLAEWTMSDSGLLARLARFVDRGALACLTPAIMQEFNRDTPDRPGVVYTSIAGSRAAEHFPEPIRSWAAELEHEVGRSDGFVPRSSGLAHGVAREVEADHLELIGVPMLRPGFRYDRRPLVLLRDTLIETFERTVPARLETTAKDAWPRSSAALAT